MARKKPFKRWLAEVQQLLINSTPMDIDDVEEIDELEWFDQWADNKTPREAINE